MKYARVSAHEAHVSHEKNRAHEAHVSHELTTERDNLMSDTYRILSQYSCGFVKFVGRSLIPNISLLSPLLPVKWVHLDTALGRRSAPVLGRRNSLFEC